jgi:hypothetical protein
LGLVEVQVVESWPSKHVTLSSYPSITREKEEEEEKIKGWKRGSRAPV